MAGTPAFATVVNTGFQTVSTANAARDGTGTISAAIISAGSSGTKVDQISVVAQADLADGIINIFLHDGTTARYFDFFDSGDPAAGSSTVAPYTDFHTYANLIIPTGWSVRASITVAPTTGLCGVFVFAANF